MGRVPIMNEHSFILSELRHEIKRFLSQCGKISLRQIGDDKAFKVKS